MTTTPAGWYPDPEDASRSRWWNGVTWTDHRSEPYSPAAAVADLKAPEGTPPNTAWIWLIVLLPMLPMIGLLAIDWGSMLDLRDPSSLSAFSMLGNPWYLLASLGGWASYGLCVWLAYSDWRELGRRSVPRPFHFAWAFLSSIVYVIGRSVVARRRTGQGIAPMWVAIASIVVLIGAASYVMVVMLSAVFAQISTLD